jgi:hypothetical protein
MKRRIREFSRSSFLVPRSSFLSVTWSRLVLALVARAVLSPSLAIVLLRVAWRFRRRRWLTTFPFLPLPARDYVRWRMFTAYGDSAAIPPVNDVIRYARWAVRR